MTEGKNVETVKPPIEHPANMVYGKGNCGIVAMAICAGVSLDVATEWFRNCRPRNRNWQGSTHHIDYPKFLREHGVWFRHVEYNPKERVRTIGDFAAWAATPGRLYAIRCADHMMVCRDGWIADQNQIVPVSKHWKRNARLKDHWEIFGR